MPFSVFTSSSALTITPSVYIFTPKGNPPGQTDSGVLALIGERSNTVAAIKAASLFIYLFIISHRFLDKLDFASEPMRFVALLLLLSRIFLCQLIYPKKVIKKIANILEKM